MAEHTLKLIIEAIDRAQGTFNAVENRIRGLEASTRATGTKLSGTFNSIQQGFSELGQAVSSGIGTVTGGLDPLNSMMGTLNTGVSAIQAKLANFGGIFGGLVAAVPVVLSLGAATQFLTKSLQDASTETQNFLQLQAGWKALNRGNTDDMMKFTDAVKALSRTSTYASQDVIGAAKTLTGFGNIATQDLLPALQVVIDTAAYMGTNVQQAAQIVGYAARGEFGMLREWGFQFSEATKQSRNFKDILTEMGTRVAGQEAAKMETYAGAVGALTKAFNRVEKAVGHILEAAAVPVIKDLALYFGELGKQVEESFEGGATEEWQKKVSEALRSVGNHVKAVFGGIVDFAASGGLERIFNGLMQVVGVMQTLVEWAGKAVAWFVQLPSWVHYAIAGFVGLKIGISVLGSLQGLAVGLVGKLTSLVGLIPGVSTGFAALGGVALGPLAAVVAAVAAMGVAVYEAASNWEDLTSFLKDDLGIIYDLIKKIAETATGPFRSAAEFIAKKAGITGPEEKPADPKKYQEYYYNILSTARVAGGTVADIERNMRAEIAKSGAYADEEKRNRLAALQAANSAVIKEYVAHQEALKKAGAEQGAPIAPEVQEKYELRLAKAKAYFDELEQIQASAHESERRMIWETAKNQEEAQLRIKQFNVRASIERIQTVESEYQVLKQMREAELQKQIKKEEGTPNAAEREKELRQKAQEEDLKATLDHQKKIQAAIQDTERQIQELYKERLDIINKIAEASVSGQKALDAISGKSRNEFQNLQVSIQRASEETQRAIDLLPQQPERALKFAESARQMWQSLAQDVNSLEKELRSTQDWYLNFYRSAIRDRLSAPDKFQFDATEALRLKEEAQKAYDAGDYRLAQERIRQARDIAATLYKEAPANMKAQAVGILEQVRGVDQTIGKTLLENAKTVNANATKQIEKLNTLVQDVWRIKMEQNTQAIEALTEALKVAKSKQTEGIAAPGELNGLTEVQSSGSAAMRAVSDLGDSVKRLGDESQKAGQSIQDATDKVKRQGQATQKTGTGSVEEAIASGNAWRANEILAGRSGEPQQVPPTFGEWLQKQSEILDKQIEIEKARMQRAAERGDVASEDAARNRIFNLEEKKYGVEQARKEEWERKRTEQWRQMSEAQREDIRRSAAERSQTNTKPALSTVGNLLGDVRDNLTARIQTQLDIVGDAELGGVAGKALNSILEKFSDPAEKMDSFAGRLEKAVEIMMRAAQMDSNINITVNSDGSVSMNRGGGQYDNFGA